MSQRYPYKPLNANPCKNALEKPIACERIQLVTGIDAVVTVGKDAGLEVRIDAGAVVGWMQGQRQKQRYNQILDYLQE